LADSGEEEGNEWSPHQLGVVVLLCQRG
jgi:hypothetical protein